MDGRRKRSRGRTARHAGVVLLKRVLPSGAETWVARYVDPDTDRKKQETLGAADALTEETRARWAKAKADSLKSRETDIVGGAPRKTGSTLEAAVARFLADNATLREKTLRGYKDATTIMVEWARREGIDLADDLRAEHLKALHGYLKTKPRRAPKKNGKRYEQEEGKRFRSPHSVNRELRALKTCLEHLRALGLVPMLSRDAIEDNLKNLEKPVEEAQPVSEGDLLKIIAAWKRHDEDTVTLKTTGREVPRFTPLLRYFVFLLLTGMREGEARNLRWDRVDLSAKPSGAIRLTPEDTKTKRGRTLDLGVSPLLRELLATARLKAPEAVFVFGDAIDPKTKEAVPALTRETVESGRRHLLDKSEHGFGAPHFTWQQLRVTCACYLVNAPGIFGAGVSHFRESKQLGHSVVVAERHYTGVVHVAPEAKTLEAAMGVEAKLREALGLVAPAPAKAKDRGTG